MKHESSTEKRRAKAPHTFKFRDASGDFNLGISAPKQDATKAYKTPNMVFTAFLLAKKFAYLEGVLPHTFGDSITRETRIKYDFVFTYTGTEPMEFVWKEFLNDKASVEPNEFNRCQRKLREVMNSDVKEKRSNKSG